MINGSGGEIVGEAAANDPNCYSEFKRIIGKSYTEVMRDRELIRRLPYNLV